MVVRRILVTLMLGAVVVAGCAAPAGAPALPAAPVLPTSATAGGTSIVAISPPAQQCCPKQTLPQWLGITGAAKGIGGLLNRLRNRLGTIWPGLEAKPEVLALTDPANLESANPAVASAAEVKAAEDGAAQKAKAIAYLASIGCAGCYPGIEEALLAALDDCTEIIRFETLKALRTSSMGPCKNCCRSACCSPKMREKMEKLAYEMDSQGCYVEPSDRVRRMARLALCHCNCVPLKPGESPNGKLPPEGPSAEEAAPPAAPPGAATASILRRGAGEVPAAPASPVGSGVIAAQPAELPAPAQPVAARPVSYEEALRSYQSRGTETANSPIETAWEIWSARPTDFGSRQDAVSAMSLARMQVMGSQPGQYLPPQLRKMSYDWTNPATIRSPELARAVATTPIGGVSGVVEDATGWHLVRVVARRPAPMPTPAAYPAQPAAYQAPVAPSAAPPASSANVPPNFTTIRLPPCDCR